MATIGKKVAKADIHDVGGVLTARDEKGIWRKVDEATRKLTIYFGPNPNKQKKPLPPSIEDVEQLRSDFRTLSDAFEAMRQAAPAADDLRQWFEDVGQLKSKANALETRVGQVSEIADLHREIQDTVRQIQDLASQDTSWRNELGRAFTEMKTKVDALANNDTLQDRKLDDLNLRVLGLERRPRLAVDNTQPQTPPQAGQTERTMRRGTIPAIAAAVVLFAVFLGGAHYGLWWPGKPAVAGGYTRDDIAGVVKPEADKVFDEKIKPFANRLGAAETDIGGLKRGFTDLSGEVSGVKTRVGNIETNVVPKLEEILKRLPASGSAVPPVSDNSSGAQRLARVEAECGKDASAGRDLGAMSDAQFEEWLAYCMSVKRKLAEMAGDEPVVTNERTPPVPGFNVRREGGTRYAGAMLNTSPVSYRPDTPPPGRNTKRHGKRQGGPDCGDGNWNPDLGKCIGNKLHHIPVSPQMKEVFSTCKRMETRMVLRGNRYVEQQRGRSCRRPAGNY